MRVRLAICAVAIALVSSGAIAQLWMNEDFGVSERSWMVKSRPPLKEIVFFWVPTLDPLTTLYFLSAKCDQFNSSGKPRGKNTITFGVQLEGLESESFYGSFGRQGEVRKGKGQMVVWDLTEHISGFTGDMAVLVGAEILASRKIKRFHTFRCELSLLELFDDASLVSATEAKRLDYLGEVARSGNLPVRWDAYFEE